MDNYAIKSVTFGGFDKQDVIQYIERAADLEQATATQLRQTVELFQKQYQALMSTFEAAAGHVTGELRKVEVNLAQLPRVMDQSGAELNALASRLDAEQQKT